MSDDLLAALAGALVGVAATVVVTLIGRWWVFRDGRSASRRAYAAIVAARLKRFVEASTKDQLDEINDETFEVSAMSLHVPSREGAVHVWFVFNQSRLFRDAVAKVRAGKVSDEQIKLFGDAIDVLSEVNAWARGDWKRSALWFWWQLRTTHRYEWKHADEIGKLDEQKQVAARRSAAREGRARLRTEKRNTRRS